MRDNVVGMTISGPARRAALPSTDFYPLAQDTAVFDQNTAAGSHIVNVANTLYRIE
jgi:hypothetical protein